MGHVVYHLKMCYQSLTFVAYERVVGDISPYFAPLYPHDIPRGKWCVLNGLEDSLESAGHILMDNSLEPGPDIWRPGIWVGF